MEQRNHGGHVVVLPYPSQGHINPLLQFAKRLASKGVKATLATTHYTVKSICVPNIAVEPVSDGFDNGGFTQARTEDVYLKSLRENGSRTLSQLIEKHKNTNFPINCVVYDSFFPWALDVAKTHGIYGAPFFTNSATVCAIFCRVHHGLVRLPVKVEELPLVLPGIPPLNLVDLPSFVQAPESYPAYLAMKLSQYSNLDKADWVFGNTFEELEGEVVKNVLELWPGKMIGPMVPSAYLDGRIEEDKGYGASLWKPLSSDCAKWLEAKPSQSVVYVSFGSMVSLTEEQMEEMAWGLKGSNLDFIWVVRESEITKLPSEFTNSTAREKGLIVTWCNQLEMLAHQAIGCFVTHCGWNSTLEGLSLGVPMVGVPKWTDQLTDAKFIEEIWGVGVRAKEDEKGVVRREELMGCLKEVMEGERSVEIRKNCCKWKELAKEAISEGGSSNKSIDEFVEQLKSGNEKEKCLRARESSSSNPPKERKRREKGKRREREERKGRGGDGQPSPAVALRPIVVRRRLVVAARRSPASPPLPPTSQPRLRPRPLPLVDVPSSPSSLPSSSFFLLLLLFFFLLSSSFLIEQKTTSFFIFGGFGGAIFELRP